MRLGVKCVVYGMHIQDIIKQHFPLVADWHQYQRAKSAPAPAWTKSKKHTHFLVNKPGNNNNIILRMAYKLFKQIEWLVELKLTGLIYVSLDRQSRATFKSKTLKMANCLSFFKKVWISLKPSNHFKKGEN